MSRLSGIGMLKMFCRDEGVVTIVDRLSNSQDNIKCKERTNKLIDKLESTAEELPDGAKLKVSAESAKCSSRGTALTPVLFMSYPNLGQAPCTFRLSGDLLENDYRAYGQMWRVEDYLEETEKPASDMLSNYIKNIADIIKKKIVRGLSPKKAEEKLEAMEKLIEEGCPDNEESKEVLADLKEYTENNVIKDRTERLRARYDAFFIVD